MVAEGDIIVAQLPQADGSAKLRPVLVLCKLPGYGDFLVCGISSQLHQAVAQFDVILSEDSEDFSKTGLRLSSVIRLTFLSVIPQDRMRRWLGKIPTKTLHTLQANLATHLIASQGN